MLEMVENRPKLVVNPYDSVRTATMTRASTRLRVWSDGFVSSSIRKNQVDIKYTVTK